jgi:uncharacterized Tic20 family protein
MDDQDQTTNQTPPETPEDNEGVPVPSDIRQAVDNLKDRSQDEGRDVVQEYEERYYSDRPQRRSRLESAPPATPPPVYAPHKRKRHIAPDEVSDNERKWAALAHASTVLTLLVGVFTGGVGVLLTMFIPLLIYFSFRKRSEFVAFQALQAFTVQLVGTIGVMMLLIVGTIVFLAMLLLSVVLIVTIILAPVIALVYVLFLVGLLLLPLGIMVYSVIAAIESRNGHNYRFPYIARWVENQMYGGFLGSSSP